MKYFILFLLLSPTFQSFSQNLQLHYDFRHTTEPELNKKNFPTLSFEYFKNIDTVGTGSFLFKIDAQLNGKQNNVSQVFTQVSQSLRFWRPKIYLSVNYSGGLGVTSSSYGFYLSNAYGIGVSYPFQWKGAWVATSLSFRINAFEKPSYDPQFILYYGRGFINYRIFTAGSFVFWTENRNQGNDFTKDLKGKKFAFFGDPQVWFRIRKGFSAGSRVNVYYHLLTSNSEIQIYPTAGLKMEF